MKVTRAPKTGEMENLARNMMVNVGPSPAIVAWANKRPGVMGFKVCLG
jgi:hypothetical protein